MSQNLAQKMEAIVSLLELVYFHLDDIPGAVRVQRYGEADPPEGGPPPIPYNVECNGLCKRCRDAHRARGKRPVCPPEEKWKRERDRLRYQYRIEAVERALERLAGVCLPIAQAVWDEHVDPWGDVRTEPIDPAFRLLRPRYAKLGVMWMAHKIPGEITAYGEKPDPVDNQIRDMLAHNVPRKRICRELKVSDRRVGQVKKGER